ncbi:premnaspirodiene oxygenase-like [Olea europaea subsp. europaea]|uniref:Premnaspirodiene oxygenase-like n=1 Tax=Olea europaea subsp. europaea TaxID=158383 RepID=A0A8S0TMP1_OLEEU|nr:premnaspirodiene oxygenase-like [Olea europaea subsp. europaea]
MWDYIPLTEWTMAELMKNPRVMRKAQIEVRQENEKFSNTDIQKINYLQMVIKESLRIHPPLPLLGPRKFREECKIDGYDIPNETIGLINVWAIGRNPEYWHDPETFEPERFSKVSINYKGNDFELIPFASGRRICPGISFAVASLELILARLLYHFDWKLPDGITPEDFDMNENYGATVGRKNSLCLVPKSYSP